MPSQVKVLLSLFTVFFQLSCSQKLITTNPRLFKAEAAYSIDSSAYKKVAFIDHSKESMPYLSVNVLYELVLELKNQIQSLQKVALIDRQEAHITVLNPSELQRLTSVAEDFNR